MLVVEIIFYDQAWRDKYGSVDWRRIVDSTACTCHRCVSGIMALRRTEMDGIRISAMSPSRPTWQEREELIQAGDWLPGGDGVWRVIELVNQRSPAPE